MPTVTLTINQGSLNVNPPTAKCFKSDQVVTWNLVADSSGSFDAQPITFPSPPPVPYNPWPDGDAQPGPGAKQWTAIVGKIIPDGRPKETYKYTVNWSPGGPTDPDIENNPGSGTDEGGGRGHER